VFKCPMSWDALLETEDSAIRYCEECDRGVHLCSDGEELEEAMREDLCVAIQVNGDKDGPIVELGVPISPDED